MAKAKLSKQLDAIYAGAPEGFIAARDSIAKRLRADGAEEAARVAKLKRPSKAAALVNRLALERPKEVRRYLDLAEKLRKATSGKIDAQRMRALVREDGELLEELVADAGDLAGGASSSTLDRVRESLQAAQVDPDLREAVAAGRLEREGRAASVGLENLARPPKAPRKRQGKSKGKAGDAKKAAATQRKRREEAKAALKDAKAEAREAARDVARAQKALAKAERDQAAAQGRAERAEAKLERLE